METVGTKKLYFCVDFEEWFHTPYLKKYGFKRDEFDTFSDKVLPFFEWLTENGVVATVFVVGDIAEERAEIIRSIDRLGHEIGCHSWSHSSLKDMSDEDFIEDTKRAKDAIEKVLGHPIKGYRAPFFSLTDSKLALLKELGFEFDSSYIRSSANEYYNQMELTGFEKRESLVFVNDEFVEYEIPTLHKKPIAGGGFFRLYPFFYYKRMLQKFLRQEKDFVFFVHPFEIVGNIPFGGLPRLNLKDRVRFQLGRKGARRKIEKTIRFFNEQGFAFCKF